MRDFLVRQIRNRGDKPYDVALDTLLARTFGDNPYAWDPIGLKDSLERVDRAALLAHYRRHYVPGGHGAGGERQGEGARRCSREPSASSARCPRARCPRRTRRRRPAPAATRDVLKVPGAQAQIFMGGLAPADDRLPTSPR